MAGVIGLPMGAWPEQEHAASWSVTDYLLANLIDAVRENTWITARVAGGKNIPKPDPHWRPGDGPSTRRGRKIKWTDLARALTGGRGA